MTGHVYGPHRDSDAPLVLAAPTQRWGEHTQVPMPDELLEQRRQINDRAYQTTNPKEQT